MVSVLPDFLESRAEVAVVSIAPDFYESGT